MWHWAPGVQVYVLFNTSLEREDAWVLNFFFLNYTCNSLQRTEIQPFSFLQPMGCPNPRAAIHPSTLCCALQFPLLRWLLPFLRTFNLLRWPLLLPFRSVHPTLQSEVTLPWSSPVTIWKEHVSLLSGSSQCNPVCSQQNKITSHSSSLQPGQLFLKKHSVQ